MDKKTKIGIAIMVLSSIFLTIGQYFFKLSSKTFQLNIPSLLTNYNLFFALCTCGIGAVLLIIALKFGDLSVIFPLVSITYVFVIIMSYLVFNEIINTFKIVAIAFIVAGVIFITRGTKNG